MEIQDRRQLRDAFGSFLTGVTVVTSRDSNNEPIGFTANSFSSVSLDPALLLISIDKRSANFDNFIRCEHFAVNILSEKQKDISNIFAQKIEDRFSHVNWFTATSDSPIISESSAWFDCSLYQVIDAGDHAILIGKVVDFHSEGTAGLGFYRGAYFTPYESAQSVIQNPELIISALIESENKVIMFRDSLNNYCLPSSVISEKGVHETLEYLFNKIGIQASPGFIYSVYEDRKNKKQHIVFLCAVATDTSSILKNGQFINIDELSKIKLDDYAVNSLIKRFTQEATAGNYSVYYGDENNGQVKQLIA
ncbi:flavin reductase family protein [Providencia vermicola]|uniref:flavin reductase family protein n=1 Tax=Providencia vermicola TaxID=333965 RepID=UPI0034D51873